VATLTLAEPVMATVLGTVVLGERLGAVAVVGICVLGIALAALTRGSATESRLSTMPMRT
jgi:DME family drug/metabolite transporter